MLLQVSGEGQDYLADLGFWDLDYERGLHTTREPEGIEAEDHMILKLYDKASTISNKTELRLVNIGNQEATLTLLIKFPIRILEQQ